MSYFRNHKLSATTNKKEKSSMKIVIIPGKPTGVELGGNKIVFGKAGKILGSWGSEKRMKHDDIRTHKNAREPVRCLCLRAAPAPDPAASCYFISTLYARRMSQLL